MDEKPATLAELREAAEKAPKGPIGQHNYAAVDALNAFYIAASPATIIALLDGYEARGKEVERLERTVAQKEMALAVMGQLADVQENQRLHHLRREAEAALRKSENRAEKLEKAALDAVIAYPVSAFGSAWSDSEPYGTLKALAEVLGVKSQEEARATLTKDTDNAR